MASEQHYRKVRSYLDGIEADGGTITTGGLGGSWVVLPTVVENAPPAARICREEVFGPVVTIAPSTMTRTPSVRPTAPATA